MDTIIDIEPGQSLKIGNDVIIKIFCSTSQVKLGIMAPKHISVLRLEVYQRNQGKCHDKIKQES